MTESRAVRVTVFRIIQVLVQMAAVLVCAGAGHLAAIHLEGDVDVRTRDGGVLHGLGNLQGGHVLDVDGDVGLVGQSPLVGHGVGEGVDTDIVAEGGVGHVVIVHDLDNAVRGLDNLRNDEVVTTIGIVIVVRHVNGDALVGDDTGRVVDGHRGLIDLFFSLRGVLGVGDFLVSSAARQQEQCQGSNDWRA